MDIGNLRLKSVNCFRTYPKFLGEYFHDGFLLKKRVIILTSLEDTALNTYKNIQFVPFGFVCLVDGLQSTVLVDRLMLAV